MKSYFLFLIFAVLVLFSCKTQKQATTAEPVVQEEVTPPPPPAAESIVEEAPIVEKEEVIVEETGPEPQVYDYFVIMGSFRILENAHKRQETLQGMGFTSELLRNEEGLYRVSVMATNAILDARKEILRVRTTHPDYSDTWLLIRKK